MHLTVRKQRRGGPVSAARAAGRGVALLEVLVALLIFMFGILGLVGLQAALTRAQTSGKFRVDATFLAEEYVGTLWGDTANVGTYVITAGSCVTTSNQVCADWVSKLANNLPEGGAVVTVDASGNVTIKITWTVPSEGAHTYETVASIRSSGALVP
jgi:type IV pilus assembly protein PilV